ncbi:hypothetical protein F0344_13390 [Streptomyces finlayi]|uniref:Uncharacterized protein n=1 Tax=Streptomyces finlayi TaxID=67296 RepID=A0A7G7BJG7_9ACTN|nr:hypothetical protein [Streptomyces finlayi]QNE75482.1 hypothetical protein F0344_13390 [Streptomyces finlayi]
MTPGGWCERRPVARRGTARTAAEQAGPAVGQTSDAALPPFAGQAVSALLPVVGQGLGDLGAVAQGVVGEAGPFAEGVVASGSRPTGSDPAAGPRVRCGIR